MEKLPKAFTESSPWLGGQNSIWPASILTLHRNVDPFLFPAKISAQDAQNLLHQIKAPLLSQLSSPLLLTLDTISPHQKELIFERFIISDHFEALDPHRGCIVDESGKFLALINIEDHLNLHFITLDPALENAYAHLSSWEKSLSNQLPFTFSPRFGYLTSDPNLCGTGLIIQAFLHLPALIHTNTFLDLTDALSSDVALKSLGQEGQYLADFVLVENRYKLGVSEETILKTVRETAARFAEEEAKCRAQLKEQPNAHLKDKVAKAFALLSHAYMLEIHDALSAMSLVHLGKELGWIQGGDTFQFFDLFFWCRRAHLAQKSGEESLSKEALPQKRAEQLRECLSSMKLSLT